MSNDIKVQLINSNENGKLEHLLKSYNSLKSILSPNLSKNNNDFMEALINLIISQLKIFLEILNLNDPQKLYELLNINNQNLSKQIAYLYEISKQYSNNLLLEKNQDVKDFTKESYSLEEPKLSSNKADSSNLELVENQNEKELKEIDNKENIENCSTKEIKINKLEKNKEKKITEKERKKERERERLIKRDREEREKLKEKERLIENLKRQEKEREHEFREKARKIMKKAKMKEREKDFYKTQVKKNSNVTKKKFKNINTDKPKSLKFDEYSYKEEKEREEKKEKYDEVKNKDNKKQRNKTPPKEKNKFKFFLFDDVDENKMNSEEKEKKYNRNNKKAKTVIIKEYKIPYLISIENLPLDKYISVGFTNRFLNESKIHNKKLKKNNLIPIIIEEDIKNSSNKINNNYRINTDSYRKNDNKKLKVNSKEEYFSLDEFLVPFSTKKGEESYLTKSGNIINKKQKDILEDYINNYLVQDSEDNKSKTDRKHKIIPMNKSIKEKSNTIKKKDKKKYNLKGTNTHYDLDDINELFQKLPSSFKIPVDEFYLRKKKASLFDRSIFKICHRVIDNYKELENKEDIFSFKSKSRNKTKSRTKSHKYFETNSINKISNSYRKLYSNF